MQSSPQQAYRQELEKHKSILQQLQLKRKRIGWLRLAVFAATVLAAYKIFSLYELWGLLPTLAGMGLLLYLISLDVANGTKIRNAKTLVQINEEELTAGEHGFTGREDGSRFLPADHPYAVDLDIFGKASVYQWLSRAYTEGGQTLLAENLLQSQPIDLILLRQQAIKEIAPLLAWRQQWQAHAMQIKLTAKTESRIQSWAAETETHFQNKRWKIGVIVYSFFSTASAVAAILGLLSGTFFSGLFLIYLFASVVLSRNAVKPYVYLTGIVKETAALQNLVAWIESASFSAPHLKALKNSLADLGLSAHNEIKKLKIILDRFDLRTSLVGVLFFNPFLLWDVRQMIALNEWRDKNKTRLYDWFAAIAEMDVLHSLSGLHFNQPDWRFATFAKDHFTLEGKDVGHPLLREAQRVTNTFSLNGKAKIGLITGSNMAGKSTFLRSLGVNVVLAQTGAPVCAASFTLSPVALLSSMRIADNLAENTSTFYAELKKLRTILAAVKKHLPVFILLDEILRGTNSLDRHKGSAAVIKQLIKEEAVAVIATHDVELAELDKEYPSSVVNYHFDVEVESEELYFDYKLKPGICQSLNASLLMKKIGIDLD